MGLNIQNNKIKAFIFDVDGTIINPHEGLIECVKAAIKKLNFEMLSDDVLNTFIGPPIQNSFQKYYNLSEIEAKRARDVFRSFYEKDEFLFKAYVYNGIMDLLKLLKERNIQIGIATYKREDYAVKLLKHFDIAQYCDKICGADFENKLTKLDIIKNCMKSLNINNPSDAIMVGDTCFDGFAANELKMDFICCTYGFGFKSQDEIDKHKNIFVANDVSDISKVLIG